MLIKIGKCFSKLVIIVSISLTLALLLIGLYVEVKSIERSNDIEKIDFIGTYCIDGGEPINIPSNGDMGVKGRKNVVLEGYFSSDIPVNKQIIMRIDNINIRILVNNIEVYSYGYNKNKVQYSKSSGNLWCSFISPGIKVNDKIKIEIYNQYTDHVKTTYKSFIKNIYVGYESVLIQNQISSKLVNMFTSIFVICIGVICIGQAIIIKRLKKSIEKLICFGFLCVSSGLWAFLDFNIQNYIIPYPVFNNSLDMISLMLSMFFLISYFGLFLDGKCRMVTIVLALSFIGIMIGTTIIQYLGLADYYDCLIYIQTACLIYTPVLLGCVVCQSKKAKTSEMRNLVISSIILGIGIIGDAICNMFDMVPFMIWFKVSYFIFIIIQFLSITQVIRNAIIESAKVQVLEEQAYRDGLTGARNRTSYLNKVKTINKNQSNKACINVFVFDINDLKVVNDTLGHESGDDLIRRCMEILTKIFNKDEVYRIGGDEFVVIQDSYLNCSKNVEDRIREEIDLHNLLNIHKPKVSIAYGVATYYNGSFEEAFSRADKEMYKNKEKMKRNKKV